MLCPIVPHILPFLWATYSLWISLNHWVIYSINIDHLLPGKHLLNTRGIKRKIDLPQRGLSYERRPICKQVVTTYLKLSYYTHHCSIIIHRTILFLSRDYKLLRAGVLPIQLVWVVNTVSGQWEIFSKCGRSNSILN